MPTAPRAVIVIPPPSWDENGQVDVVRRSSTVSVSKLCVCHLQEAERTNLLPGRAKKTAVSRSPPPLSLICYPLSLRTPNPELPTPNVPFPASYIVSIGQLSPSQRTSTPEAWQS